MAYPLKQSENFWNHSANSPEGHPVKHTSGNITWQFVTWSWICSLQSQFSLFHFHKRTGKLYSQGMFDSLSEKSHDFDITQKRDI